MSTLSTQSANATQVGGVHYVMLKEYQPWSVMQKWMTPEEFRGYLKGCALKYIQRERLKGGKESIQKAAHCLQYLAEVMPDGDS